MKNTKLNNIILCSLFTAFLCISSVIIIPTSVPFTLQTLIIFTGVGLLKLKCGLLFVLVYIALGFIGMPVFAGLNSGIGALFSASGGFILGFIPLALIEGLFIIKKRSKKNLFLGMLFGLLACYLVGCIWYSFISLGFFNIKTFITSFLICVAPFILPDIVKIFCAIFLITRLEKYFLAKNSKN